MKLVFFDMDNKQPMTTEGYTEPKQPGMLNQSNHGWLVPNKDAVVFLEGRYWDIRSIVYRYEIGEVHIRLNPI